MDQSPQTLENLLEFLVKIVMHRQEITEREIEALAKEQFETLMTEAAVKEAE